MATSEEKMQRILKEIDLSDPATIGYFGVSPQRRLAKLSASLAAQVTIDVVEETDALLQEVTELLSGKTRRWLSPFLRVMSFLPFRTPEERYKKLQRRLQENLENLQQVRTQLKIWKSDISDITRDLKAHQEAATHALKAEGTGEASQRLAMRKQDVSDSLQVAGLLAESLAQRDTNFSLLAEQLQTVMGTGSAAWHVFRAQLQQTGTGGVARLREIAQACQRIEAERRQPEEAEPPYKQ